MALAVISVAGCSSSPPDTTPPSSPATPDKTAVVSWVDQVCAANKACVTVSVVVTDGIDPAPVARGDELVGGHRKGLDELVPKLQQYLDDAQRFPPRAATRRFTWQASTSMTWWAEGPGLGELRDTEPVLAEAYRQAPNCTS